MFRVTANPEITANQYPRRSVAEVITFELATVELAPVKLATKPGVISPPRLTVHKQVFWLGHAPPRTVHSLTGGCRVRKMRQPESNVSRMIGQTISHYRIVEKRYGCGLQPLKKMKADQAAFMEQAAGPH